MVVLPNSAAFMRVVKHLRYVIRRLKRAGHVELITPLEALNKELLQLGRDWEDSEMPYQDALADRDSMGDDGDDLIRDLDHSLGSRSRTARKEPPYAEVFPQGLPYYANAPIGEEETRRLELSTRGHNALPEGDAALPILAAIEANTAEWVAAQKAAEAAILAREQSRERLDACRRRVDEQLTSTYGALTQIHKSKAAANRYFP